MFGVQAIVQQKVLLKKQLKPGGIRLGGEYPILIKRGEEVGHIRNGRRLHMGNEIEKGRGKSKK